jgi:hypothetical protein
MLSIRARIARLSLDLLRSIAGEKRDGNSGIRVPRCR